MADRFEYFIDDIKSELQAHFDWTADEVDERLDDVRWYGVILDDYNEPWQVLPDVESTVERLLQKGIR